MIFQVISEILPRPIEGIKKLTGRFPALTRTLVLVATYAVWTSVFRLFCLTFTTYLVVASSGLGKIDGTGARLEEINEAYGSIELIALGIGSVLFVLGMKLIWPERVPGIRELFSRARIERSLARGLLQGAALAGGLLALFIALGDYRYLGTFLEYDENPLLGLGGALLKAASLFALVLSEEILFRHVILQSLRGRPPRPKPDFIPDAPVVSVAPPGGAVLLTALLYTAIKLIQLDPGWMQGLSLFLMAVALGRRVLADEDFSEGAGFWAAILIAFHPLLGLPVFGNDAASGLALVKYQPGDHGHGALLRRLLTGGPGGPLASLGFQIILTFDILRGSPFNFHIFRLFNYKERKRGS